jgi:hypothetical protein
MVLVRFGLSSQVLELMAENDYEILKEEQLEQGRFQQQKEDLQPSGMPVDVWLSINPNPKSVDDEPCGVHWISLEELELCTARRALVPNSS